MIELKYCGFSWWRVVNTALSQRGINRVAVEEFSANSVRECLQTLGISLVTEWDTLAFLYSYSASLGNPTQIAQLIGYDKAAIGAALHRLEELGLLPLLTRLSGDTPLPNCRAFRTWPRILPFKNDEPGSESYGTTAAARAVDAPTPGTVPQPEQRFAFGLKGSIDGRRRFDPDGYRGFRFTPVWRDSDTNVILAEGTTGSGKTLLGTEFIYRGITQFGEPGIIVHFRGQSG